MFYNEWKHYNKQYKTNCINSNIGNGRSLSDYEDLKNRVKYKDILFLLVRCINMKQKIIVSKKNHTYNYNLTENLFAAQDNLYKYVNTW